MNSRFKNFIKNFLNFILLPITIILKITNIRFFYLTNPQAIGHLALEPECYIKEYKAGLCKKYRMFIVSPPKSLRVFPHDFCNKSLLNYWKKYFIIITSPLLCLLLWPLRYNKILRFDPTRYLTHHPQNIYKINKLYKKPLLHITQEHLEKGKEVLSKLKLPKDTWYVCFNARNSNFYSDSHKYSHRNSDIDTLFLALKEIESRGGWCIRMGSKNAPILPDRFKTLKHLIDYPKTPYVSDWMDVFLAATCIFFLGSSPTGLNNLPMLFNRPVATANIAPIGALPHKESDLSIFKLYYSNEKQQFLTLSEIMKKPIPTCYEDKDFLKEGIKLIDNSEEEIKDLAIEMLDKLENKQIESEENTILQNKFSSYFHEKILCYGFESKINYRFLKKYEHLIR